LLGVSAADLAEDRLVRGQEQADVTRRAQVQSHEAVRRLAWARRVLRRGESGPRTGDACDAAPIRRLLWMRSLVHANRVHFVRPSIAARDARRTRRCRLPWCAIGHIRRRRGRACSLDGVGKSGCTYRSGGPSRYAT
jgi:hypothetical protein